MTIKQKRDVDLSLLTDGLIADGRFSMSVETRLMSVAFELDGSLVFNFVGFIGDKGVKAKQIPVRIHVKNKPTPADPPTDEIDPDTLEVLIPAGARSPAIPSVAQFTAMPLPNGNETVKTFGELLNVARRKIYLTSIILNPEWADGVES